MTQAATEDGRPESLQSYAERRIKTVIATGTFPPGSRLSPNLLAAEFGLSHIPIRRRSRRLPQWATWTTRRAGGT